MINADMREYSYYLYGDANAYGQPALSKEAQGVVKMAIYSTSQAVQANIKYKNASYVGFTHDSKVNDTYVIQYGNERLKVLYVQNQGRYKQVFLGAM
jgi:hypothetical protein